MEAGNENRSRKRQSIIVGSQIFEPSAASDDSKKEPKFTTDKSSKDQLSEGKAVRDLLFRLELVKE